MLAWIRISLRRLRDERTAVIGLSVLVFLTAFVFAVAPRVLQAVSDAALHDEVAAASSGDRNIQLSRVILPGEPGRPSDVGALAAAGADLQTTFPEALGEVIAARRYAVETPQLEVVSGAPNMSVVRLRIQEDVEPRIRLVRGHFPTGTISSLPNPNDPDAPPAAVVEAVVNKAAAEKMGVSVGSTLSLSAFVLDHLNDGESAAAVVRVVGVYEVIDPKDAYWIDDLDVMGYTIHALSANSEYVASTLLASPDTYAAAFVGSMQGQGMPLVGIWRFGVDPARLTTDRLDDLIGAMRRLETLYPAGAQTTTIRTDTLLRSGLSRLFLKHAAEWRSAGAVLSVAAFGTAVLAVATLAAVAILASAGRRRTLFLSRSRGASPGQVFRAVVVEGLLIAAPAVVIATALALGLVPVGPYAGSVALTVAICAVTVIVLLLAVRPAWRGGVPEMNRGGRVPRLTVRRLVVEVLAVCLALGGAVLLRDRGVVGASSTGSLASADPLIVAAPALAAVAAGIIVVRVYPYVVRAIGGVVGRRRDLVPILAVRRATRGGSAGPVLLILLATAAVGTFASLTRVYLDRSADTVSWQRVGADYRLVTEVGAALPADLDISALPGVEAASRASWTTVGLSTGRSRKLATVELAAYKDVLAGTLVAIDPPAEMAGRASEPLPTIVSAGAPGGPDDLSVGDLIEANIAGDHVKTRVVEVVSSFPGVPEGEAFMLLAREQLAAVRAHAVPPATVAFLRASESGAAALDDAVERRSSGIRLDSRVVAADAIRAAPVMEAVSAGMALAAIAAVAYGAVAVAASLALVGAARREEAAQLKAVGLSDRQSIGLLFAEYGPTVVVAFSVGLILGLGLFSFLLPGLGLGAVVGSNLPVPVVIEPSALAVVFAAIVAIVVCGWLIGAILQRGADQSTALRRGME